MPLSSADLGRLIARLPGPERSEALRLVQRLYGIQTGRKVPQLYDYAGLVYPGFRWFPHTTVLGEHLQRVSDGEIRRLMVYMPPRHGKTILTSQIFPAHFLSRYPAKWVGAMSYAASLVKTNSRNARAMYRIGGGDLRSDSRSVYQWETTRGGGYWCAGTRGGKTGKGFHVGIVDDPVKGWKEAQSVNIREEIENTYDFDFTTRGMGQEEAIILVMTRWSESDLGGFLLNREYGDSPENWHVIHLEAIRSSHAPVYPPTCTVAPDWREIGEALCDELRPLRKLWETRGRNPELFGSLYQQQPRPRAGKLFKRHKFRVVHAPPAGLAWGRGWDLGASDGMGDYSVGARCGMDGDGRFFIDLRPGGLVRGQWESGPRDLIIRAVTEQDGVGVKVVREQEGGSGGKDQASAFTRNLRGFDVEIIGRKGIDGGNKAIRAEPLKSQVDIGNVFLIVESSEEGKAILEAFLAEICAFPGGQNDDQVDAVCRIFNWLAQHCEGISEELRLVIGR